jgi:MerR family transcriptional regulator, light-induced transcriptional regulator
MCQSATKREGTNGKYPLKRYMEVVARTGANQASSIGSALVEDDGMTDFTISSTAEDGRRTLLRTIEGEVIPRLVLAHRGRNADATCDNSIAIRLGVSEVRHLARLVISGQMPEAASYLQGLLHLGMPPDVVYLDLLAPVARKLGVMWDRDQLDFVAVTLGLRRLQQLAHQISENDDVGETTTTKPGHRALLVALPGEQHVFGTQIVGEMLRRSGWDIWDAPGATERDIIGLIKNEWFAVVGLSISAPEQLEPLALIIRQIRRQSLNQAVRIMVGGHRFAGNPDWVALVGADATAADGRDAVRQAERLLELVSQGN